MLSNAKTLRSRMRGRIVEVQRMRGRIMEVQRMRGGIIEVQSQMHCFIYYFGVYVLQHF